MHNRISCPRERKDSPCFGAVSFLPEADVQNLKAAECMGKLYDSMKAVGCNEHTLVRFLVRFLFCFFAEDTGIFKRTQFQDYLEQYTYKDGSDLEPHIATLFKVLNTPEEKRDKLLPSYLSAFPYVNGKLFEEHLPLVAWDPAVRRRLLDCCKLDWSRISPAIFGSLFQSIMKMNTRRTLGAHYTSEVNILKLIKPLFLDELWEEFAKVKHHKRRLSNFHKKLRTLRFLDPACGCGNFLIIAYRELRLLELEVLRYLQDSDQQALDIHSFIWIDVDQFYGIEIEEFPAQIAQVALWLMEHQMNLLVSKEFGKYFLRIPLPASARIVCGNALRLDWEDVIPSSQLCYILGNPPFVGKTYRTSEQRADFSDVLQQNGMKAAAILDFVAAWFFKAAAMMKKNHSVKTAFISTNSITQGAQVPLLWTPLLQQGFQIHFAHRSFLWGNESNRKASVHCVILGFCLSYEGKRKIYDDERLRGHGLQEFLVQHINPYLKEAPDVILPARSKPLCEAPIMRCGSKPVDGKNLLLSAQEKAELIAKEPAAEAYLRPFANGYDYIHNVPRFCLWLRNCSPHQLQEMPEVRKRVEKVRTMRMASKNASTRAWAQRPTMFIENSQPTDEYLAMPRVSSAHRVYVPIGFLPPEYVAGDNLHMIPKASLYHLGVLTSLMHMSWMRSITGRLGMSYSYSTSIVYNNFPWPTQVPEEQKAAIEARAQAILDVRLQFPDASLATLYNPHTMPAALLQAHQALDDAVDAAYGRTNFRTEVERMTFLLNLYQDYACMERIFPKRLNYHEPSVIGASRRVPLLSEQ